MWASPIKDCYFGVVTLVHSVRLRFSRTVPRPIFNDANVALGLNASDTVLVLVPHPDDETLGMGASMAALCDAGVKVHLLLLTDGSLSGAGELGPLPADQRARIRGHEFRNALKELSPQIFFSGPVFVEEREITPEAKAHAQDAARKLVTELRPKVIFAPPPFDFHPHHQVTAELAARIRKSGTNDTQLYFYEIQTPFATTDPWIAIANSPSHVARCQSAERAYASQAQSAAQAARLKGYRRVQTKSPTHVEAFLNADLTPVRDAHSRGFSRNSKYDLRLMQ